MSACEQLKPACRTYLRRLSAAALSQMALFPHLFSLRDLLLESNDTIEYVTSSSRLFITEIADSAFALASSSNTRSWYQDQVSKLREPAPHSLLLEDPHKVQPPFGTEGNCNHADYFEDKETYQATAPPSY